MKHVFVETNFLVGMARPLRDETAARLAQRDGRDLRLHVPWCSVTEARRTLLRSIDDDLGFDQAMIKFAVRELLPAGDHATLAAIDAFSKPRQGKRWPR